MMRAAGDSLHAQRLRGLIAVLWRAGLRKADAAGRSAWTTGHGKNSNPGSPPDSSCQSDRCSASSPARHGDDGGQPRPRATRCATPRPLGRAPLRPNQQAPRRRSGSWCRSFGARARRVRGGVAGKLGKAESSGHTPLRTACTGRRSSNASSATATRHHLDLSPRHRQRRNRRHRPRLTRSDDPRTHHTLTPSTRGRTSRKAAVAGDDPHAALPFGDVRWAARSSAKRGSVTAVRTCCLVISGDPVSPTTVERCRLSTAGFRCLGGELSSRANTYAQAFPPRWSGLRL